MKVKRVKKEIKSFFQRVWKEEEGQAMTEYFIMIASVVVSLIGAFRLFVEALHHYYTSITRWVSLPIP